MCRLAVRDELSAKKEKNMLLPFSGLENVVCLFGRVHYMPLTCVSSEMLLGLLFPAFTLRRVWSNNVNYSKYKYSFCVCYTNLTGKH